MPTNRDAAREKYQKYAASYDRGGPGSAFFADVRRELVSYADLKPGDAVLDVACGTGLSFPMIQEAIGESGRLIGVDLSAEMLERARERIAANGWKNVTLVHGAAEDAHLGTHVDALVFCLTHDVLQSPHALENLFRQAQPPTRVAAFGPRRAPWWAFPMNLVVVSSLRKYTTTREGLSNPWAHLIRFVPNLHTQSRWLGSFEMAWGATSQRTAGSQLLR